MNKVIGFFIFFFSVSTINAQNVDIDVLKKININRNTSLDGTFKSISQSAVPISVATPILIYTLGMINNDSVAKQKALFIGETFLASAFITVVSKKIIKTDRPYDTYPMIQPVVSEASYSMPSGHTSTAFATATSLSLAYPKWYVVAPSFVWAGAIGYSRMHLGVHYPSDVLAGALVGSGSAYLTYKANQWINKKRKKK
ncbi:phosphatase PAP2 family protein [Flavobacterium ammonificans]|uniref:Phosphatase PAP2 family protein n=1 Tax=Flavobacterium ammonificans TaxID=1751056 RepID=A0ABN6KW28_9FLAO|nr:phosphatase PAP2 family protein [Flavobacterium ammonificans]BDB53373.1 phosphatase PAP2 family protein [Flavobacterium ammonificans]